MPFNFAPSEPTTTTIFGDGIVLGSDTFPGQNGQESITSYCIGCGVSGTFALVGNIQFDVNQGLTTANLDMSGSLHSQLVLAVVGEISGSASTTTNLITQGIPGWSITNIITIGPSIALDVGANVDIQIAGGIEVGYILDWPALDANIDLINPSLSTYSGYIPNCTPQFDFSESVTINTVLYATLSLQFGVNILSGKYVANAGIVNKPEVDTSATQQIYSDYELSQLPDDTVICNGIGVSVSFLDSVYAELAYGAGIKSLGATKTYPLTSWAGPSTSTCIG